MVIPKNYLVASLIISIILLIALLVNINTLDPFSNKFCIKDSDCVLVKAGCCGCNMGGKNTAINEFYEEYWIDNLSIKCTNVLCPMIMSDDPSCFSEPRCIDRVCTAVPN